MVILIIITLTNTSIHLDSTTTLSDLVSNTALVKDKAFIFDQLIQFITSPSLAYSIIFYLIYKGSLIGSVKLIVDKHYSGLNWREFIKDWIDYIKKGSSYLKSFSFLSFFFIFTRPFKSKSNNEYEYKYKLLEPRNRYTTYHERPSNHSSSTDSDTSFYVRAFNNNEVTTIEEAEQVRMMLKLLELRGQMVNDVEVLDFLNDFGNYTRSSRVRDSVLSMRRSLASSIDPFNRFDINKQLPPLPHTQHIRDVEIMNTELARFINDKYGIHPSTLPRILEEPENNDWDIWSFTPIFLINIDLMDLTIKDYNIWCKYYPTTFIIEKELPLIPSLIPLPKELPPIPIQINFPYEPFIDYLLTLGDINLYFTNYDLWTLLIIILALLFFWILPFYLLVLGNISSFKELSNFSWITLIYKLYNVGYLQIRYILIKLKYISKRLIKVIFKRFLIRIIYSLILLTMIYLFDIQEYMPSFLTSKLKPYTTSEYFSNTERWWALNTNNLNISLYFEVEGLAYLLELFWNKALLILNLQLESYSSTYNPLLGSNPSVALEELSATQIPINVVMSGSSFDNNYLTTALVAGISILTIGVIYYLLNTNISDLEAKLETLDFDVYHGANTIQLLEDKVQVVLTNQQSILDGKVLILTTPQNISRMISVDHETNSINEVLFENRITQVDLPSTTQEIKEIVLESLIDDLM
jgi:hypothetical protein